MDIFYQSGLLKLVIHADVRPNSSYWMEDNIDMYLVTTSGLSIPSGPAYISSYISEKRFAHFGDTDGAVLFQLQ